MSDPPEAVLLLVACDPASAGGIARTLVEERLAACVSSLAGVESVYRWRGEVEQASEVLLLVKTAARMADPAMRRIKELHPYEVPEILVFPAWGGWPPYLHWLASSTGPEG